MKKTRELISHHTETRKENCDTQQVLTAFIADHSEVNKIKLRKQEN